MIYLIGFVVQLAMSHTHKLDFAAEVSLEGTKLKLGYSEGFKVNRESNKLTQKEGREAAATDHQGVTQLD